MATNVNMAAPIDESRLPIAEQIRILESDLNAQLTTIEQLKLQYRIAAERGDAVGMADKQRAANESADRAEAIRKQLSALQSKLPKKKKK